jgi:hypothetical protein
MLSVKLPKSVSNFLFSVFRIIGRAPIVETLSSGQSNLLLEYLLKGLGCLLVLHEVMARHALPQARLGPARPALEGVFRIGQRAVVAPEVRKRRGPVTVKDGHVDT